MEWIDGNGNQPGFLYHDFQPKGTKLSSDRVCLFRYVGDQAPQAAAAAATAAAAAAAAAAARAALPRAVLTEEVGSCAAIVEPACDTPDVVAYCDLGARTLCCTGRRGGWNCSRILGKRVSSSSIYRPRVLLPAIPRKQQRRACESDIH